MTLIRFTTDYRGVLTEEAFYKAGAVADLAYGSQLVESGRAELVASIPAVDPEPDPSETLLDLMSLKELRAAAKDAGIKGAYRMKRETLIDHLS